MNRGSPSRLDLFLRSCERTQLTRRTGRLFSVLTPARVAVTRSDSSPS
jgi:hypothetical protein